MQYQQLGKTGLRVSAVGLGGNTFGPMISSHNADEAQTARIIDRAIDLGVNHIDTADVYSSGISEEYVGKALAGRRQRVVIATKFRSKMGDGPNDLGASRGHLLDSIDGSLRRLRTDYVDVYYIHSFDPTTPLEETLRGLDDLVRLGKVRYPACSNFAAWQIARGLWIADRRGYAPFAVVQSEYNVINRRLEAEVVPACRDLGVGIVPYSPLAGGILTGKYRRGEPAPAGTRGHQREGFARQLNDRTFDLVDRLTAFARERGHSIGDLAMAWLVAQPEVCSVIAGATAPEQVEENVRGGDWALSPEDLAAIDAIVKGG